MRTAIPHPHSHTLSARTRTRAVILSFALVASLLHAQQAAEPAASDETIVLSPFTVQTSQDVGYEASSSLAGTGLNTKLTDLGSSVSVITAKFLEDTASTNLRELLVYQTNMETTGFGGNLSGTSPAPGGVTGEPSLTAGNPGTRVRGLAEATQARNFFRNYLPMDSYNTDRVEINRGANALLFGVGSPAGIINTTTSGANVHKTTGSLELTGGSFGSTRGVLRLNQMVLRDEAAIFFAALRGREKYQQEFAFNDSDRQYLAGTWDIRALRRRGVLSSTTLRASFENGEISSNRPRVLTPSDRISSWFDATLPEDLRAAGAKGKVGYDPRNGPFNVFNKASQNATIGVIENVNRSPTFFFQDVNATAPRDNIPTGPGGVTVLGRPMVTNNIFFPSTGKTGIAVAAYSREMSRVRADYGLPDQSFYTSENLTDPSVFDFFNNTLVGPNSEGLANLRAVDASIEQLAFDRKLGLEVSVSRQRWQESLQSLLPQSSPYISIDVNTHMWTGEVNPNYGRPFISTSGRASWNDNTVESGRAKLFYKLDLPGTMKNRLGWWLGSHIFSGLAQRETLDTDSRGGGAVLYTPDRWTNGNDQSRTAGQSKGIVTWVYLGPSLLNANSPSGAQLPGLRQNLLNYYQEVNGKGVVISRLQAPTTASANDPAYATTYSPLTVLRENRQVTNTATFASLNERVLNSRAISAQSNWLGDHVVSTVGWRREQSSIRAANAPFDPTGEGYVRVDSPQFTLDRPDLVAQTFSETLFAWSAVAKTPAAWLRRVPFVSALNVYYGTSENFSPPGTKTVDTFGTEIEPPRGITKEYGTYVEVWDGRLSARLNIFETTQTGDFNSTVGNIPASIIGLYGSVVGMVRSGNIPNSGNGTPPGFVAPPQALLDTFHASIQPNGSLISTNPGVRDTSDFVTKGGELEISLRPTRGLSFVLNVSKQESVRSNTGAMVRRLLFETPTATGQPLAVEWLKPWALQIPLNAGALGKEGTNDINILANAFQNQLNTFNVAVSGDGAPVQELRKWRSNFVGNYQFQSGRLKGWGIGSGVRWQDKAAIGFPVANFRADLTPVPAGAAPLPSDIRISDVRHPFYGPTETRVDGWVSYQTRILDGRVPMKIQLNVRNMFTNNELVPTVKNPDGRVAVWSIAEGRKITVSAKFSF